MRRAALKRVVLSFIGICVLLVGVAAPYGGEQASAAGLAVDVSVKTHPSARATSITTAAFSTTQANDLLVAFISGDGPGSSGSASFSSVTTSGLIWKLRQRANTQAGTAEIWEAAAPNILTNVTVKATRASGTYVNMLDVVAFKGADTSVDGAVAGNSAATGAPTVSLTTTRASSWVWAVGTDWSNATARTVGAGQTKFDEYLAPVGDTYWLQNQTALTTNAGTSVTMNDTAPTTDKFNFAAIEILSGTPPAPDTTPPSAPANLNANAVSPNQVNLSWTASTDNVGVTGYRLIRDGVQVGVTTTATTFNDTTVSASTQYAYTVRAYDPSNNVSADSNLVTVNTPAADTTPPAITAINASAITQTNATINWNTDEPATSQVEYGLDTAYGANTTLDTNRLMAHSQSLTGLAASTTYHYRVKSTDASANSAVSADNTFTTLAPAADTTPPSVSITNPVNNATVTGTLNVTATAADNVGVAGVQFKLDGAILGAEDTAAPYSISWNTTGVADGAHILTATARDAAGNSGSATNVTVTVSNTGNNLNVVGQWAAPVAWPEISIHAALTPTGKVLTFQGDFSQGGQQYLLNPADGGVTQVPNAAADLFCAGQAVLADGRILVVGGTSTSTGGGIATVTAFNSTTETWQTLAPMNHKRWYATGTTLGDGRVLVTAGSDVGSNNILIPEIYTPQSNTWTDMPSASQDQPYYPFTYQLPDGRVLWAGASEVPTQTKVLNVATQTWTTVDSRIIDGSSIVNYAPGKFMKAGSAADSGNSGPSAKTAFTLDMNQPNATWQPTGSMQYPRSFLNLTNLPDGTVLATGGDTEKSGYNDANGVLPAEIWTPATGTWSTVASMSVPRLYHSTAVLLPDGRVFVSGGGGDANVPDHQDYQMYSPSYLFKGARPTISSAPTTVQYNTSTFVGTPDGSSVASVSLIRTGSVTHSFDQNARALSLSFTQTPGGLNIQMPQNGNYAPPGYYMLSIVNTQGVPSIAAMVRFPAPFEDAIAPTAPADVVANGAVGKVTLNWTASTDNIGVASYVVYRSTTPNFTASAGNQVGRVTTTTFTDSGLIAGTYYYQIKAEDAAGNTSPPSNEVAATATADTTVPDSPTNLTATAVGSRQINVTWTASSDNVGVVSYTIKRDGNVLVTVSATNYADTTVAPNTTYSYTVVANDAAGNTSAVSNTATATTPVQGTAITFDKQVTTHQTSSSSSISSPALTTAGGNELLVAFLSSDGPGTTGSQSFSTVTGAGLIWTLRQRTNTQAGTAEIWTAYSTSSLTNAIISATRGNGSWVGSITVAAFSGADSTVGAVKSANASSGAPTATLTTTRAGSWIWGVGNDWSNATSRTVGTGQTLVDQYLASVGDTFWVQRQTTTTPSAGTQVTLNDTAPTADMWNLSLIEILAAP
ncbi:MAG: galactose oxidase-like domain-containing protein [Candidatus Saccharimonadales bacterium]